MKILKLYLRSDTAEKALFLPDQRFLANAGNYQLIINAQDKGNEPTKTIRYPPSGHRALRLLTSHNNSQTFLVETTSNDVLRNLL